MSPAKKQFSGPIRVPVQKPVRPAPPPPSSEADDDDDDERLIHDVEQPGWSDFVDAPKYDAMQSALLRVVPSAQPGLTQAEIFKKVLRHLPASLFPGGAKAQWWARTVALDLEFKKVLTRTAGDAVVRWFRTAPVTLVQPGAKDPFALEGDDPGARKRPHRHERKPTAANADLKAPTKRPAKGKGRAAAGGPRPPRPRPKGPT